MSAPSRQERMLNLVSLLLRSRRPVPWGEIRSNVVGYDDRGPSDDTVRRRFERDKATLREMGIPIEFDPPDTPGGGGYRIPRGEAFLPRLELTPEETAALAMLGRFAQADVAGAVSAPLAAALQKLQFDAPVPQAAQATVEERYVFHRFAQGRNRREAANLRAVAEAVVKRRTIAFTYYAIGADKVSGRKVDPYGVGFHEGRWYVVGRSHKRRAVRSFRMDRIRGDVKLARPGAAGPDFEPPKDFSLGEHLGRPPWAFGRSPRVKTVVRFSPKVAWMVKESLGDEDKWADLEDGGGVLERPVADADAMLCWVLRFGPEAVIEAPEELRRKAIEVLKSVREMHASER